MTAFDHLFLAGPAPRCADAADTNDDGQLDLSDPVVTLQFLFLGGDRPPEPYPAAGPDTTPDSLGCAAR